MNLKRPAAADIELFTEMLAKIGKNDIRVCQREAITAVWAYRKNPTQNGYLFKICCGGGKTLIEAFFILKEILKAEKDGRKARICIASHRLLLNNQLLQNVYEILNAYGIKVWYYSASSVTAAQISDDKEIQLRKFGKDLFKLDEDGERMLDVINKHIVVLACAKTENSMFKDELADTEAIVDISETNSSSPIFDLVLQDEAHKECNGKLITSLMKLSKFAMFFTATPSRMLERTLHKQTYTFNFKNALSHGYVVRGRLFIAQHKAKMKFGSAKQQSGCIAYAFEHLQENCTGIPILLNYLPSVDNMPCIAKTLRTKFADTNIVTFASYKKIEIKNEGMKTGEGYEVKCMFNEEELQKEELLNRLRAVDKPTIILSAFMIVEGIDLPSVNGVGIWCDKNDANMFQAACRGCRTAKGKEYYNIYVPKELSDCQEFLRKLYNGFDGELDYGDGQEDCCGTGSSNDADDADIRIVPAAAIKIVKTIFEEAKIELDDYLRDLELYNMIEADVFTAKTAGEAVALLAKYVISSTLMMEFIQKIEERY